uniref:ionotropic receptor 123 precursor n=1 Tax=Aedes aegypti TaxID=7159 RepID=UPI000C1ED52E|nr:ionotropic receptor 123 precursor [Aedes aegypti]
MRHSVLLVTFFSLSYASSTSNHQQSIVYTSAVIRNLSDKFPGTFDCWFYNIITKSSRESIMDSLVADSELSSIPKLVMTISKPREITRHPELIVVYCDDYKTGLSQIWSILIEHGFHASVKIIAIYQMEHVHEVRVINKMFTAARLYNVIFLRTPNLTVSYEFKYTKKFSNFIGAMSFDQLFVDQTRDLDGYTMHISVLNKIPATDYTTNRRKGHRIEWLKGTAVALNASCQFYKINCDRMDSTCEQKSFLINQTKQYDINVDASVFGELVPHFMPSIIPNSLLIVVPRGERLSVLQLFIMPFSREVWITLLLVVIICILLMILFPNRFVNNLILLPVCGFERCALHNASKVEKLVILSLTVFFFLMTCAYEAKIMALLSEMPHDHDLRTFEDLLRKKITIYLHTNNSYIFQSKFQQVFKFKPEVSKQIGEGGDGVGYVVSSEYWLHTMNDPKLYDPETGRNRYIVLDEFTLGTAILHHFVGIRNPLAVKFQATEKTFFEAGLIAYWIEDYAREVFGTSYSTTKLYDQDTTNEDCLMLEDFIPAWRILIYGCSISLILFVMELVSSNGVANFQRKFRSKRVSIW